MVTGTDIARRKRGLTIELTEQTLIVLFCVSAFLIAVVPAISLPLKYILIPAALIGLYKKDSFNYILFPLTFLDNMIGTYVAGRFTLLWFYLLVLFIKLFVIERRPIISTDRLLLLAGIVLYFFIYAIFDYGMNSVKMLLFAFCAYSLSMEWIKRPELIKKLEFIVIISALVPAVSLLFGLSGTMSSDERTTGIGFSDPNYASMVCVLGLCAAMNYATKRYKLLSAAACIIYIVGIFRAGSRTGLLVVCIVLIVQLVLTKSVKKKLRWIAFAAVVLFIFIFFIIPQFSDVFSPIILRFERTWDEFSAGNYVRATANRTSIAERYLEFFSSQGILKKLFGGNVLASSTLLSEIVNGSVTHNVYLDYLMGFGIVGGVIMMGFSIMRMFSYLKMERKTGLGAYKAVFLMKISFFAFGVGLALMQTYIWWFICLI